MFKKTVALLTCAVMAFGLSGCFRRDEVEDYDPTKTYLYIGNYDGGLGDEWLSSLADEYMKKHTDVIIKINNHKDNYADATLLERMDDYGNDMYFVNAVTYSNYVGRGKMLDITDVVTEDLDGESESIEDKMNPTLREYYKTDDNKYYAVPFFDSIFGTVYDVDLFEQEGLYFNENGNLMCDDGSSDVKSAGPNGISGDYDDGLPATFSQWKELMYVMQKGLSIVPYIWTGEYTYYRYRYLTSIWADYEGKDNFDLNMTFDGSYTFPGDVEATPISVNNAYLLQKQPGKKYALDYAEYIIRNGLYATTSFDSTNTHMMAQRSYLLSAEADTRYAMIIEGGWWENEANDTFLNMSVGDPEMAKTSRRFGFMPMPKATTAEIGEKSTMLDTLYSMCFINKNVEDDPVVFDLAKKFLMFANTQQSLEEFTVITSSPKALNYEISEENQEKMSYFARDVWNLAERSDIVYPISTNPLYLNNQSSFGYGDTFASKVNGTVYTDIGSAIYNFKFTPKQLFDGIAELNSKANWESLYSQYFGD